MWYVKSSILVRVIPLYLLIHFKFCQEILRWRSLKPGVYFFSTLLFPVDLIPGNPRQFPVTCAQNPPQSTPSTNSLVISWLLRLRSYYRGPCWPWDTEHPSLSKVSRTPNPPTPPPSERTYFCIGTFTLSRMFLKFMAYTGCKNADVDLYILMTSIVRCYLSLYWFSL